MAIRNYQGIAPVVHKTAFVDTTAVILGDVHIGADSSIWPLSVLRGDMHRIRIGDRTSIQDGSILHITHDGSFNPGGFPLVIGDDVTVGHQVILHGCTLHNRILIGMGCIVLDGAVIEDEVMLGAHSLVPSNKVLQSGYLYLGSPAKQIRPLTEQELAFLKYSAANYVALKDKHITEKFSSLPIEDSNSAREKLEIQLAFQEDTLNQLNDIIFQQQKRIDKLEKYCRQLAGKVNYLDNGTDKDGIDRSAPQGADEKPPHY